MLNKRLNTKIFEFFFIIGRTENGTGVSMYSSSTFIRACPVLTYVIREHLYTKNDKSFHKALSNQSCVIIPAIHLSYVFMSVYNNIYAFMINYFPRRIVPIY